MQRNSTVPTAVDASNGVKRKWFLFVFFVVVVVVVVDLFDE